MHQHILKKEIRLAHQYGHAPYNTVWLVSLWLLEGGGGASVNRVHWCSCFDHISSCAYILTSYNMYTNAKIIEYVRHAEVFLTVLGAVFPILPNTYLHEYFNPLPDGKGWLSTDHIGVGGGVMDMKKGR
jgi:hypothetical protein